MDSFVFDVLQVSDFTNLSYDTSINDNNDWFSVEHKNHEKGYIHIDHTPHKSILNSKPMRFDPNIQDNDSSDESEEEDDECLDESFDEIQAEQELDRLLGFVSKKKKPKRETLKTPAKRLKSHTSLAQRKRKEITPAASGTGDQDLLDFIKAHNKDLKRKRLKIDEESRENSKLRLVSNFAQRQKQKKLKQLEANSMGGKKHNVTIRRRVQVTSVQYTSAPTSTNSTNSKTQSTTKSTNKSRLEKKVPTMKRSIKSTLKTTTTTAAPVKNSTIIRRRIPAKVTSTVSSGVLQKTTTTAVNKHNIKVVKKPLEKKIPLKRKHVVSNTSSTVMKEQENVGTGCVDTEDDELMKMLAAHNSRFEKKYL